MDISELLTVRNVKGFSPSQKLSKEDMAIEARKVQAAKDFESVFIQKLLDQVKESAGSFGLEEDGASEQIQGIFWMNLSKEIADQGGFGLWKDIYKSFGDGDVNESMKLLDESR